MNQIACLIAEDEPIAREIVQTYCRHLPYLNVIAACSNALEAKIILQTEKIDILFLDINMPVIDGISFSKTLKTPPQIIFTTAYKEFALDAFELSAVDYLLKPFSLERFIIAVDKAMERIRGLYHTLPQDVANEDFIFIKTDGKIFKIRFDDIFYAEANGNYTKIVTRQNMIMPAMTFSTFEGLLPSSLFIRIHRSFIISKSKIGHIEGNRVYINNIEIPIGSNYKDDFMKELGIN